MNQQRATNEDRSLIQVLSPGEEPRECPQDSSLHFPPQLGSFWLPYTYGVLYSHPLTCLLQLPFPKCRKWDGILFIVGEETEAPFSNHRDNPKCLVLKQAFLFFSFLEDYKQNGQDKDSSMTRL